VERGWELHVEGVHRTDVRPLSVVDGRLPRMMQTANATLNPRPIDAHAICAEIQGWTPKPAAVAVFGSAARGDGTTASDIDVLVVRDESVEADDPQWQRNLASLADHVSRWSGNSCEILERSPSALEVLAANGERLIGELRRDAIFLHGDDRVLPPRTGAVA
jgi:predicted nucleotidyltransferase